MAQQKIPFYFRGEPLVIIPFKLIIDKDSKGSDLLVYLAVSSYADWSKRTALASQEEIMERSKFTSVRTIKSTMSHLVEIGWATKIRRGLTQTNIVILHAKKNEKISERELKKIRDEIELNGN